MMKKFYTIILIIVAMIINQQAFSQKQNSKGHLTGEQEVKLSEGYSFVSSRIIAENPDMLLVMADVLNDNLDFVRNSLGQTLYKIGPNWVNGIGEWIIDEGYLVKMFAGDSFIIAGDVVDPVTPIQLEAGFQFVSYFPETPMDALSAFGTIIGGNLKFIRNSQAQTLRKIGLNWINGIGDCNPGEGYLIKMLAGDILIYPGPTFICGDTFTDLRDEQIYSTLLIGDQCWMAENLSIGKFINSDEDMTNDSMIEKYCYNNDPSNCETYGGLYQWNEMMEYVTDTVTQGICPAGFRLPTDDEWKILEGTVDSQYPVGDPIWNNSGWRGFDTGLNLKSTTGWDGGCNGSGLFGYEALPSGRRFSYGYFNYLTYRAYFWSSSEYSSNEAWSRMLDYNSDRVYRNQDNKDYGFSVRCLKDNFIPVNLSPWPPSSPNPEDGSVNQSVEVDFSWTCTDPEGDTLTYDIYFGTEATPPLVATGQTGTTYNPGILVNNTKYFWKIVAHDDRSNTTEGPVWNFNTEAKRCPGIPTVTYEGQVYNTVLIGDQCWLRENLNVGTMINGIEEMTDNSVIEKYCYDNNDANCDEYGGLYQWNEMMEYVTDTAVQGICPEGWHLPTDFEWKILEGTVDSQFPVGDTVWNNYYWRGYDVGRKLKFTTSWNYGGNGTNTFGFTTLPCGYRHDTGNFYGLSNSTSFWSSSEPNSPSAWYRVLYYNYAEVYRFYNFKTYGFSVRCIQN